MANTCKCIDCGRERTLTYDTHQCHECEQLERERELDAMELTAEESLIRTGRY